MKTTFKGHQPGHSREITSCFFARGEKQKLRIQIAVALKLIPAQVHPFENTNWQIQNYFHALRITITINLKQVMEEKPITTKEKVKQMKGWENIPDELAEQIAKNVRRFAELFYRTISRQMSLAELPANPEVKVVPLNSDHPLKQDAA